MPDAAWQKVREIFDAALRRRPEERRSFVNEACGDDKTLLAEVESLLSSLDSAESFMETPAVAKVADVIEAETKQTRSGKMFRPLRDNQTNRRRRNGRGLSGGRYAP